MTGLDGTAGHDAGAGPRVVVIGGGVGGLAAAALLARGGARVTLVEALDRVGGRAGLLLKDGFTFDTGPSWYLMREAFDQFFALMGTSTDAELDLVELDPRYRVFFEPSREGETAEVLDVVADPEANYARFDELSPGDGAAMRRYATEAYELYRLALDRFLYTTYENITTVVDSTVLRRLPLLASLLTRPLGAKIVRRVKDARLRQVLGFHAVFLGSSPSRAPSLFSLMSHLDLTDGVRYPKGGMYQVIRAIERVAIAAGATVRTSSPVTRIVVSDAGLATGVELASGEVLPADIVVSGADLHHTETALLERKHQTHPERRWARRAPGVSALLVFAGVRGELPQIAHHSLFFTRDWESNFKDIVGSGELRAPFPASVYVSRVTASEPSAAPAGYENLVMLVPFPADPSLGDGAESRALMEQHALRYFQQVGDWAGVPDLVERTTIHGLLAPADFARTLRTWRGSALGLEHTLLQSAMFRPGNASSKVANLLYVGSSTVPGIGMPICLISAELVAKRLLGDTSVAPLAAPIAPGFLSASPRKDVLGALAAGRRTSAGGRTSAGAGA